MFENLWRMQEILLLGILGLNSCVWKLYHHILMHFVPQLQCFELFLNVFFPKTVFFLKFSEPLLVSIDPFYFSINRNFYKIVLMSLCLFRLIETVFRSFETRESGFLKTQIWLVQTTFSNFHLSLLLGKAPLRFFVIFGQSFCKVFLSLSRYVHCTLSFSFIFCFTCIFSCIEGLFSDLAYFGIFDDPNRILWNWTLGFCSRML